MKKKLGSIVYRNISKGHLAMQLTPAILSEVTDGMSCVFIPPNVTDGTKYTTLTHFNSTTDEIQSFSCASTSHVSKPDLFVLTLQGVGLDKICFFLCLFCFSFLLNIFTYFAL